MKAKERSLLYIKTYGALDKLAPSVIIFYSMGPQILQKSRSALQILTATWVARNKFHTENAQILGATVQNFVAQKTLAFLHQFYRPLHVHVTTLAT
jgi:hypothetical protein